MFNPPQFLPSLFYIVMLLTNEYPSYQRCLLSHTVKYNPVSYDFTIVQLAYIETEVMDTLLNIVFDIHFFLK